MNTAKKIIATAVLALAALGLFASLPALADGASDAALYCSGCHAGLTVNGMAVGGGAKSCAQRSVADWTTTIERMNGKGCGVPSDLIAGIADYLANLKDTTSGTNHVWCIDQNGGMYPRYGGTCQTNTCYYADGTSTSSGAFGYCPAGTNYFPPPTCADGLPTLTSMTWTCPTTTTSTTTTSTSSSTTVESTTTTTYQFTCYNADGSSFGANGYCPIGTSYSPPPPCPGGVLTPTLDHWWTCSTDTTTSTTTSTTVTTVATTTTTTLCNTYVNGTTQYPYSGKGSCHGHSDDGTTTGHVVRDQKWCRKHMTHFNSSGNHTHAYPHPACM